MQIRTSVIFALFFAATSAFGNFTSGIIYPENGRLTYVSDDEGNRIPDFSHAGYEGGGVLLPDVPAKITISPIEGDNSVQIQNAIDQVGALPPGEDGFRGAVKLTPGNYPIENNLYIRDSGVVLRGSGGGSDPAQNSIIRANRSMRNTVLTVGGNRTNWNRPGSASTYNITTDFVPVGARSFEIDAAAERLFVPGDNIVIRHPSTQEWLDAIDGGGTASDPSWTPGSQDIFFNRIITAVNDRTVTLDAPVYNHLDRALSQSYIYLADRSGLISRAAVEDLRIHIETAGPEDEDHARNGVLFVGVENGWARNVSVRHYLHTAIGTRASTFITVKDSRGLDPHSLITGARRYPFNTWNHSNNILFTGCFANEARHCYVSNGTSSVSGIVFHNSISDRAHAASEGHRHWSQGLLFDNITFTNPNTQIVLGLYNRGSFGTGHGWSSVHSVSWNSDPGDRRIVVQRPPTGQNYGIGNRSQTTGSGPFSQPAGYIEGTGENALPSSLYQTQLDERLTHGVAPDAPLNLHALSETDGEIRLSWEHTGTETGVLFLIERVSEQSQTWQQIGTVTSSETTFTDEGLTGGNYRYRIRTSGEGGRSAYSIPAQATLFGLNLDFKDQTVGEAPSGFTTAIPGTSSNSTDPVPLTSSSDGPTGNIIVDEENSPVPSINGRSVRLYDYSTSSRAKLSRNFIPEGVDPVAQIRFDFTFRRSVAIADGNWGQGMIVGLGETDTGLSLHQNANRALNIRITNDGRFRVVGTSFGPDTQIEDFDELGTHEVSVFANVQDEPVTYLGPDDEIHELSGHCFSVFLNGVLFDNNNGLLNDLPALGKFAFVTGQGNAQSDHDFVIDDLRVTDFSGPVELPGVPQLRIALGESAGQINLSWDSSNDVTYGVQRSPDLLEWTALEPTFMGDGGSLEHTVSIDDADRGFYRLISPVDFVRSSTAADFVSTQNVRKWATHDEEPDLIGTYDYRNGQSGQIGKAGPSQESRTLNSIHGFQLPTLEHDFEEAIYTITKTGANGSPDGWSAQLYIFEPQMNPQNQSSDDIFRSAPGEDTSQLVRPLSITAMNTSTANGAVSFTLSAADLAGFYNPDRTPASAHGMIWFRLNPGKTPDGISNFERLEIQSALDQPDSPTLHLSGLQ